MPEPVEISCDDLDEAIEQHKSRGFRLDMIFPADSPREALMSKGLESVRLVAGPASKAQGIESRSSEVLGPWTLDFGPKSDSEWIIGRAGMEYRDLIPGRLGGKVIASHIRLPFGGEVPDSVHYHKIDFQMIYCVRGRIKVVYEGQGEPFWLETGDCILQPPEIRHRVIYSDAGAEVIEVTSPAEHETWIDHDLELPTDEVDNERLFGGQRFVHSQPETAEWKPVAGQDVVIRETGIFEASGRLFDVRVFQRPSQLGSKEWIGIQQAGSKGFTYPLGPGETLVVDFTL